MHAKQKHLVFGFFCMVLMLVGTGAVARSQVTPKGRAMVPADLLTTQGLGETVLSPDGKWAAIVVERPRKAGEAYERGYMRGLERSDIWLASTDGRKLLNATRGEAVHAGYWNPVWSPDGKRLAMASTRGGDNVRAYIYDLNTRHLRACINDGVDLGLRIEMADGTASTMAWLNSNELLLGVLPPAVRPLPMDEIERTLRISAKAMDDVKRGRGVTVSILDTEGIDHSAVKEKNVTLSLVDVVTNKARVLTRLPLIETRLTQRIISISPDRTHAAMMVTNYRRPVSPEKRLGNDDLSPLRLGIMSLETHGTPVWVQNVRPATFGLGVVPTPIRWAPKGSTFAFIAIPVKDVQPAPSVFTVNADEKQPLALSALKYDEKVRGAQFLAAEDIQWTTNGELLVYGYTGNTADLLAEAARKDNRGDRRDNSTDTAKRDWWVVSSPESSQNLTREVAQPPRALFKTQNSNVMFGAGGGRIWTLDVGSQTVKPLTVGDPASTSPTSASPRSVSIVWPRAADVHRAVNHLIVSHATATGSDLFRIDVSSGTPVSTKLGTIPRDSVFSAYSDSRQLVTYDTEITEVRAISSPEKEPVTLISLNRQLDAIAKPEYRTIQYQTSDGQKLSGALLLPYGYTAGRRYPLIVHVYGGSVAPVGNWANPYKFISRSYIDPLIRAGRGYAVLIPTMPLQSMGKASDPMLEFNKSVQPAIDKVVEMGIADPERLGVMGHSFGGYTVYSLVTQTGRFKAAVAYAGATDLLSLYGGLDPRYRFSELVNPWSLPFGLENQQHRMGSPPWKDLDRYLRNSPYIHADKVTTPLLMIHGELDSYPLAQAEKFYVALNRMGKRAKLVRYLAEGHVVESPGNLMDMWEHILNWFDQFLQNPQHNQSAKTK